MTIRNSGDAARVEFDKLEQMRRAGLYFGPVILAAFFADAFYQMLCHSRRFPLSGGAQWPPMIGPFLVFAVYLAWRMKDPLGRLAFAMFAFQEALLGYAVLSRTAPNGAVLGSLLLAFATLLTASGARGATPRRLALGAGVFVAMFLFGWWTHYNADAVGGRHSVLSGSPICSIASHRSGA